MGYIYKITNKINNCSYIGQTRISIEERFKHHYWSSINHHGEAKDCEINFPLHQAIRKYGIENFKVECIEECSNDLLNEKEIYWIKYYNTYNEGYNASLGGEGYQKYDYDEIVDYFLNNGKSILKTCQYFKIYDQVVYCALKSKNIDYKNIASTTERRKLPKKRILLVEENIIFNNMAEIDKYFGKQVHGNIRRCLNGITEKAYGYHWKEIDEESENGKEDMVQ